MQEIKESIEARVDGALYLLDPPPAKEKQEKMGKELAGSILDLTKVGELATPSENSILSDEPLTTPPGRENPEPVSTNAPLLPSNHGLISLPAMISGEDAPTPTPTPTVGC